ncbi:MAG: 30S ribosomal protein S1 [Deltaproteobacteria bacterium]|nr:30S ribosomal protein S1 [Deltaproteobacteria bacterium]
MSVIDDKTDAAEDVGETEFERLYKTGIKELEEGEVIKGRVVKITSDSVVVDIGYKSEGVVPLREFLDRDGKPTIEVGAEIAVLLEKLEDDLGYVILSKARADQITVWDDIVESHDKKKEIEGTIVQAAKGGFYVDIKGVQAFLPSSQVDLKPARDPQSLIGKIFRFLVIKYNRRKNNVIVSRRIILEEKREMLRKETLAKIEEGAVVEGTVKNITDYGAFIDLGGVDGLAHLSDLSWGKVTHPSQVLRVGDNVRVKILKFDRAENKISLGVRQTKTDPWTTVREKYPVGSRARGRVTNLTDYGAFVEIEEGLEGLIHISEMSWTKIRHPSQKLKGGDTVEVMVLDVDSGNKRLSLGLKQVEPNPWDEIGVKYPPGSRIKGVIKNITDFGVFVGVEEGIDGLVHISDLSWRKVKHPSEVFTKGTEVEAVVLNVDKDAHRFSLSTKILEKNPWEGVEDRYRPGMTAGGRITSVADFGAFVEIEEGLEGLVHISELTRGRKTAPSVKVGDMVEVEILNVNPEEKKIGLSIRSIGKTQGEALMGGETAGKTGENEKEDEPVG